MVKGVKSNNIYEKIGWTGLLKVVWNSMPYGLSTYKNFLKGSSNLRQLLGIHSREYMTSKIFRLLRPRYHKAKYVLKAYGIEA